MVRLVHYQYPDILKKSKTYILYVTFNYLIYFRVIDGLTVGWPCIRRSILFVTLIISIYIERLLYSVTNKTIILDMEYTNFL